MLLKGLKQVMMMIEFTKACNVDIRFHGRGKNESTHYCGVCEVRRGGAERGCRSSTVAD